MLLCPFVSVVHAIYVDRDFGLYRLVHHVDCASTPRHWESLDGYLIPHTLQTSEDIEHECVSCRSTGPIEPTEVRHPSFPKVGIFLDNDMAQGICADGITMDEYGSGWVLPYAELHLLLLVEVSSSGNQYRFLANDFSFRFVSSRERTPDR